ncbi:hypothetical protein ACMBCN_02310, partial [Candidatus Liberibacter asiaticus]|nr:hypothetical protein [Candidatus Liberibacter asiaticus]
MFKIQTLNSRPQNPIHTISFSFFSFSLFSLFSLLSSLFSLLSSLFSLLLSLFLCREKKNCREFFFFFREFQKFSENSLHS